MKGCSGEAAGSGAPMDLSQKPASMRRRSMISQRKIDANRRNARKSTGPRTEEGKNQVKLNALKHGLTARTVVLPHEDEEAYQQRREAWSEGPQPGRRRGGVPGRARGPDLLAARPGRLPRACPAGQADPQGAREPEGGPGVCGRGADPQAARSGQPGSGRHGGFRSQAIVLAPEAGTGNQR